MRARLIRSSVGFLGVCLLSGVLCAGDWGPDGGLGPWPVSDSRESESPQTEPDTLEDQTGTATVRPVSRLQPQPMLLPSPDLQPEVALPEGAAGGAADLFGSRRPTLIRTRRGGLSVGPSRSVVRGVESKTRAATDAGSLLGKSPNVVGIGLQRRTPIVTDPRVRGSRVGQLAASGSYWVPARIDLDTALSKIDSRLIDDVLVIKGPYAVRYGPGLQHVDVHLLGAPRFVDGFEMHESSSVYFGTNGKQWYGRQDAWGGSDNWGFRVGYGHRTANDYRTGSGVGIPSSYKSRELNVALGADLSPVSHIEFLYLRLDQTDVEFPGQAFDMDYLVTDGYELRYALEDQDAFDLLALDVWFNETRFKGNNLRAGKRRQFPLFDFFRFRAFTDVDSVSSGFRLAVTWGEPDEPSLTAGVDLRFLKQELDEISSGRHGVAIFTNANSPLPKSEWVNPGLFLEHTTPLTERLTVTTGARADLVFTDVVDPDSELAALGTGTPQSSLADILGTDRWNRQFAVWTAFVTANYALTDSWTLSAAFGHGERPPSLTELYVAQSFLFLLQNGQNTATGDPRLDPERSWQIDLALQYDSPALRAGVNAYHAWIHDYITFENLNVFYGPPAGQPEQVSLKYVNTKLATLAGVELYGEYDVADFLTTFATLQYVEGRDHTRNGEFATRRAAPGQPSTRVYGLPRGYFSGIVGGAEEPLPNIVPLESRLGVRLHDPSETRRWGIELSARVVDNQDRVASSLLETPTPGFTVWDVRSYWRPTDHLLLIAGVENFTDKNYREHLDYRSRSGLAVYQPGVNFYFSSELTY